MRIAATLFVLLSISIAVTAPVRAGNAELQLVSALGGKPVAPVIVGDRAYLATGRIITALDYRQFSNPRTAGDSSLQPASGRIVAVAHYGGYLYAAWDTLNDYSGVAIYSLRNPDQPRLVAEIDDYTPSKFRNAQSIAVVDDYLYLFDSENGIFVARLSDPEHPSFRLGSSVLGAWQQTAQAGTRIYTSGRNWSGQRELQVIDIQSPTTPVSLGVTALDPFANFSLAFDNSQAFGFGYGFSIHESRDPKNIETLFSLDDGRVNFQGLVNRGFAYAVGNTDIQPWDLKDLRNPVSFRAVTMDTFATDLALPFADNGLLVTRADRVVGLDLSTPQQPRLDGEMIIKGAVDAYDIGFAGDVALILQNTYGLHVAKAKSFDTIGRLEIDLPPVLQQRAFEQMTIDGDMANLASWGAGLFMVDISDPSNPFEVGHWPDRYTSTVDVSGNIAVVGRSSDSGGITLVDVSSPSRPSARGSLDNIKAVQLRIAGQHALVADRGFEGGLRIIDISNVDRPAQVGRYNTDCESAIAIDVDEMRQTAFLLCPNGGLHIVDISNPARPSRISRLDLRGNTEIGAVAWRGDRVYVAGDLGFDEIDVRELNRPALIARHPLPSSAHAIRFAPDGRVVVLGGAAGLQIFERTDAVFADGFDSAPR